MMGEIEIEIPEARRQGDKRASGHGNRGREAKLFAHAGALMR